MALIHDVQCARCDRRFSALRSRCPYCGTPRRKHTKRADGSDDNRVRLLIGILLLVIVIAAVVILLVTALGDKTPGGTTGPGSSTSDPGTTDPGTTDPGTTDPGTTDPGTTNPGTTDPGTTDPGTTDPGTTDPGTTDPGTTDPAPEPVTVTSLMITAFGKELTAAVDEGADYDITMEVTESLSLGWKFTPADGDFELLWASSDNSVAVVMQTGKLTAVGAGTAKVTLTVGNMTKTIIVRVNSAD